MNRITGRNIYIVDLATMVANTGGTAAFVQRCKDSQFQAIWARLGYAQRLDPNFTDPDFPTLQTALAAAGVDVWGWHVSQCPDLQSAANEAKLVVQAAHDYNLTGVLLDAEQNGAGETRYFLGGSDEADCYASTIQKAFSTTGQGLALSSNDQPQVHQGFPFDVFLKYVNDNCPQVYYTTSPAEARLDRSIAGYTPLEAGRNFQDRYKPVGNITVGDDVGLPDQATCIATTKEFIGLMPTHGFKAYGFWCWDDAPASIWDTFKTIPVA